MPDDTPPRFFTSRARTRLTAGAVPIVEAPHGRLPGDHTERVATTGGTAAARNAGPSTAICPIAHSASAPAGR